MSWEHTKCPEHKDFIDPEQFRRDFPELGHRGRVQLALPAGAGIPPQPSLPQNSVEEASVASSAASTVVPANKTEQERVPSLASDSGGDDDWNDVKAQQPGGRQPKAKSTSISVLEPSVGKFRALLSHDDTVIDLDKEDEEYLEQLFESDSNDKEDALGGDSSIDHNLVRPHKRPLIKMSSVMVTDSKIRFICYNMAKGGKGKALDLIYPELSDPNVILCVYYPLSL